ncbi:hypothetical protein ACFL6Y_08665 [Elusimicrobiota bacterium]
MFSKKLLFTCLLITFPAILFARDKIYREFSVGFKHVPGRYLYREAVETYNSGSLVSAHEEQGSVKVGFDLIAVRIAYKKDFNLATIAVETGVDVPSSDADREWTKPATYNYTGGTRFPAETAGDASAELNLRKEVSSLCFPLMFKIEKLFLEREKVKAGVSAAIGRYLILQTMRSPLTSSYKQASGANAIGDMVSFIPKGGYSDVETILEFKPRVALRLSKSMDLGLHLELGYLSHFGKTKSIAGSAKTKYRFGGFTYGLGASLNF